ncbi:MAG TPA: type II secretion system F family protein [Candidatus Paceibacterota bacterium]|nr:type II secretion system F family protein [Candidatus Paceibacterota bacterium]
MKFTYKGRTTAGALVDGTLVAETKGDALLAIRDSGIKPILIAQKKGFSFKTNIVLFKRVKLSEKIMFTKNIAGMLKAGLPLSRALEVLRKQTTQVYFQSIIAALLDTVDRGETFSDGLAKFPKVFSPLFVSMVRAGEESGSLPESLNQVGVALEKTYTLNRKIKSALMYPAIIVSAIFLIGILMFIYVVPTLTKTFKELGAQLPLSTRIVVGISDAFSQHLPLIILGIAVVVAMVMLAFRLPKTKRAIDFLSVRLPVLGTLVKEINAARTTRTLASLLVSGVNIDRAIIITKDVLQNTYYKDVLGKVVGAIEKGAPMSSIFKAYPKLYPTMVGEMMEVGEETGKLSGMLSDIASFYEGEVDAKTKDLSTIIEPVLMILIGAAVGFFAISMLSPMYSIMDAIK